MSKKQADYTVGDILRLRPDWFIKKNTLPGADDTHPSYEQTVRRETEAILGDMHQTLELGFIALLSELWLDVFGTFDILAAGSWRKSVFEYRTKPRESNAPRPTGLSELPHADILDISSLSQMSMTHRLESLRHEAKTDAEEAARYQQDIEQKITNIRILLEGAKTARIEAELLEAKLNSGAQIDASIAKALARIPKHWVCVGRAMDSLCRARIAEGRLTELSGAQQQQRRTLFFVRTKPVIHTHSNSATRLSRSLDFGYILVGYDVTTHRITYVHFFGDTINRGNVSAAHPHVSGNSICWGNTQPMANRLSEEGRAGALFELFDNILETYGESPYESFDHYHRRATQRDVYNTRRPSSNYGSEILPVYRGAIEVLMKYEPTRVQPILEAFHVNHPQFRYNANVSTSDKAMAAYRADKERFYQFRNTIYGDLRAILETRLTHEEISSRIDDYDASPVGYSRLDQRPREYYDALTREDLMSVLTKHGIKTTRPGSFAKLRLDDIRSGNWSEYLGLMIYLYGDIQSVEGSYIAIGDSAGTHGARWYFYNISGNTVYFIETAEGKIRKHNAVNAFSEESYDQYKENTDRLFELSENRRRDIAAQRARLAEAVSTIAQTYNPLTAQFESQTTPPSTTSTVEIHMPDGSVRSYPADWMNFDQPVPQANEEESEEEPEYEEEPDYGYEEESDEPTDEDDSANNPF